MEEGVPMMAAGQMAAADEEAYRQPAEQLAKEALPQDVQDFIERFPQIRKKMGGMNSVLLKDASLRPLPDYSGVQIILGRELPVDEGALAEAAEQTIEKELKVHMKVQISTPRTDNRASEPAFDLSQAIYMDIDIE